jgi:hypothetical protein
MWGRERERVGGMANARTPHHKACAVLSIHLFFISSLTWRSTTPLSYLQTGVQIVIIEGDTIYLSIGPLLN